jgi:hypothetical protein
LLLAAPGPVMAQGGAGDQQYQDPLGQVTKPAKNKARHKLVCRTTRQKHTRACRRLAARHRAEARKRAAAKRRAAARRHHHKR